MILSDDRQPSEQGKRKQRRVDSYAITFLIVIIAISLFLNGMSAIEQHMFFIKIEALLGWLLAAFSVCAALFAAHHLYSSAIDKLRGRKDA